MMCCLHDLDVTVHIPLHCTEVLSGSTECGWRPNIILPKVSRWCQSTDLHKGKVMTGRLLTQLTWSSKGVEMVQESRSPCGVLLGRLCSVVQGLRSIQKGI